MGEALIQREFPVCKDVGVYAIKFCGDAWSAWRVDQPAHLAVDLGHQWEISQPQESDISHT